MIPKQTTPLAKAIRTLEGQLITASNVAVIAVSAVDPHTLPPKYAAIVVAAQNIALALSRALVKAKTSKTLNALLDATSLADVEHVIDIPATDSDAIEAEVTPARVELGLPVAPVVYNPDFAGAAEVESA